MLGRRLLLVLLSVALLLGVGSGQAVAQRVPPGGAPPPGSGPRNVPGFVRVIDGDSLELWIDGKRTAVGLSGVDAPQGNTECGREAASTLRTLVRGGIRLEEDAEQAFDDRKRRIYHAVTQDGRSIGEEMVKAGLSRANRHGDARPRLEAAEATARSARRGCAVRQARGMDDEGPTFAALSLGSGADAPTVLARPESVPQQPVRAAPSATNLPSGFSQETVASGLTNPTAFASLPDGRFLIAEKDGLVKVFKNGALLPTPMLDIRDRVNDYWDRGLLGITADPAFAANGYIYLLYTYENDAGQYFGTKTGRLARYTVSGDVASVASETVVLGNWVGTSCNAFPAGYDCIPSDSITHGVGNIKFASDGTMFLTVGDAAAFNVVDDDALRAQNLDSLAGKVIHITTSGQGVPGNPYWNGDPNANRSKVWASGLRNPYRFGLQPGTNVPYLGDVGWNTWEEVNSAPAGANLGWPCFEGNFRQSGYEPKAVCQALYNQGASAVRMPLVAWDHTDGNGNAAGAAATGGVFYTGTTYPGAYQGVYFYGDYAQSFVRHLRPDASHNLVPGSDTSFATAANGPVDIEMGPDGNLYYLAIMTGELRRIRYTEGNTPPTATAAATPSNGIAPLGVQFSSTGSQDPDGDPLIYDWDFGDASPHSSQASPQHTYAANGTYTATLTVSDGRGGTATATATITVGNRAPTATISAPATSVKFKVGDVINYAGSGTDPEDGVIPAGSLAWQVILHHCPGGVCHAHPLTSSTGPTGSFTAPDHGDESHFELKLTATDSTGLSTTTSMLIQPQTVQMTLASNPDGLQVIYDGTAATAPKSHTTIVGSSHTIQVQTPQGGRAAFASWSDGGAIQHDVVAGATDATYTATFTVTPAAPRSISLNGISAYGVAPHHAELNTTGDWTVEAWFKDESPGGFNHPPTYLLGKSDTNSDGEAPYLVYVEWGSLFAGERTGWGNQVVSRSLAGVDANSWHHVAVTMNSTTRQTTIYLDGVQVAQGVLPTHSTTGNSLPVSIGRNGTTGNYWRGKLDDVRIWNVTRTGPAIAGSFQDELVGTPAGLVGHWKIDEGTGTSAADSAGALQHALLQGATWSTDAHGAVPAPDTTPPVISAVQSGSLASTGATISWTTDEAADSQVEYGTTVGYGSSTTLDTNRVASHAVSVSGLTPSATYHYRVKSRDAAGNLATSGDFTFSTTAPAPPPTCPCSIWPTSATPGTATAGDTQAVEVGVKLRSDVDGYITGIRFYKGAGNMGTHVGSLWTSTGTRLANATFSGEAATGWQQVTFAAPVQVTANTTYVASYHAPNGGYARDPDFFATNGVDSGSLHALASPVSGGNGVYKYGPAGSFPDQSYAATNYWVDVVFTTTPPAPDTTAPVVSAIQATAIASNGATITWTTDEPADSQVEYGTTTAYGSSTTLDASMVTGHSVPVPGLTPNTTYHYRVKSKDAAGNLTTSGDFTFTTSATAPPPTCPCTIWPDTATPAVASESDPSAFELGVKFRADVSGYVTGIRFYKGPGNTGTHVGNLWSSTGTNLATATFTGETALGWQQVTFAAPVQVTANTTYVASYHAPNGGFAKNEGYFATGGFDRAPLHALASPTGGGNGVYKFGPSGFPDQTYNATNYWVDVVFTTTAPPPDTTAPVVSVVQATNVSSNSATVTWTTNEAADSQVEYGTTPSYGAQSTLDTSRIVSHAVAMTGLTPNTLYHYRVKSRDTAGNLATSGDFTFTTAAPPPPPTCPCTIWPPTATPQVASESDTTAFELGVKFRSDVDGYVTGIRFYKGPGNTGIHVGNLWNSTGTNLATVTFTGETATGWQQASFSTPVQITANTTYVASYHVSNGGFAKNEGYFSAGGADRAPLHALASPTSGGNGVYKLGTSGFPTQTYNDSNYWVDVVFTTTPPAPDTTPPTISAIQVTNVASNGATITWTTNEPADSQVEYGTTNSYGSQTTINPSQVTAHSVPVPGLTPSSTYHYRVKSRDAAGNLATSSNQTFTTGSP